MGESTLTYEKESCDFLAGCPSMGMRSEEVLEKTNRRCTRCSSQSCRKSPLKNRITFSASEISSRSKCAFPWDDCLDSSYPTRAARHGFLLTQGSGENRTSGQRQLLRPDRTRLHLLDLHPVFPLHISTIYSKPKKRLRTSWRLSTTSISW